MTTKKPSQIVNAAPYVGMTEVREDGSLGEHTPLLVWDYEKKCLVEPSKKSMLQGLVAKDKK